MQRTKLANTFRNCGKCRSLQTNTRKLLTQPWRQVCLHPALDKESESRVIWLSLEFTLKAILEVFRLHPFPRKLITVQRTTYVDVYVVTMYVFGPVWKYSVKVTLEKNDIGMKKLIFVSLFLVRRRTLWVVIVLLLFVSFSRVFVLVLRWKRFIWKRFLNLDKVEVLLLFLTYMAVKRALVNSVNLTNNTKTCYELNFSLTFRRLDSRTWPSHRFYPAYYWSSR